MKLVRDLSVILLIAAVLTTGQAWAAEKGAWKKASRDRSVATYEKYLKKHPDGPHAQAAHEAIEELRFEAAKREDTIEACEEFLARYPAGPHADELSNRSARLLYNKAARTDNIEGYEAVLQRYPTSLAAMTAFRDLRGKYVEREEARVSAAWSAALETGTIATLERFLVENPGSPFITEARRQFEDLGRDPLIAAILTEAEEDLRKRNELDKIYSWFAISVRAVIPTTEPTYLVLKDSDRKYQKVTGDGIEPFPPDYELLTLRFTPPWHVAVLFLNPEVLELTGDAMDSFRFTDVFLKYFDARREVEQAERGLTKLWIFVPAMILRPEDRAVEQASGIAVGTALKASTAADAAVLEVIPRPSPADTEAVRTMINALAGMIGGSDEEAERRAVGRLLSLDEPAAVEAIRTANPSRAGPLGALLVKGTPESRRWACGRLAEFGRPVRDDLTGLVQCGYVEVEGEGSDIRNVYLRVRRLIDEPIKVTIPAGTLFAPDSETYQNMVSRAPETFELKDNEWTEVRIRAACANRTRSIPTKHVGLKVAMQPPGPELARLMPVLAKNEAPFNVAQAAVWIVTDDSSYSQLGRLIRGRSREIGPDETASALRLLVEAKIDICSKRIRGDVDWLLESLDDGETKTWLATLSCGP